MTKQNRKVEKNFVANFSNKKNWLITPVNSIKNLKVE